MLHYTFALHGMILDCSLLVVERCFL